MERKLTDNYTWRHEDSGEDEHHEQDTASSKTNISINGHQKENDEIHHGKENEPVGWTLEDSNGEDSFALRRKRSNSYPFRGMTEPLQSNKNSNPTRLTATSSSHPKNLRKEVLKLSSTQIQELTSAPESLPIRAVSDSEEDATSTINPTKNANPLDGNMLVNRKRHTSNPDSSVRSENQRRRSSKYDSASSSGRNEETAIDHGTPHHRLQSSDRNFSYPFSRRKRPSGSENPRERTVDSDSDKPRHQSVPEGDTVKHDTRDLEPSSSEESPQSPSSSSIPLPPFSIPTYLHLELSSGRPSALYIQRPSSSDTLFESSKLKFDRLVNFLLLPPQLERLLLFGALTCLDAWLYTFTILPLRFLKAIWMLLDWFCHTVFLEAKDSISFVRNGLVRIWHRNRTRNIPVQNSTAEDTLKNQGSAESISAQEPAIPAKTQPADPTDAKTHKRRDRPWKHRRTKSTPSSLQPGHKADILQGLLIIISCMVLMRFNASKMYHGIRVQAAIKLYVIYNVLEVCDRLFSALGQDILECLFSSETLERKADGRSKIGRPFWMFVLALIYTIIHATTLFYQVVTLNVAVNSYSNALLTLLMSNQFVEIKGTVFKKFEKENLFQLTCADVVERFQLWFMLLIIALRNIVEMGGLSFGTSDFTTSTPPVANSTSNIPFRHLGILPKAFTMLPSLMPAHVLGPFLIVLGSEMLVDWLKHAYITKFNATSPAIYGRFFDILAKDYYANAFAEQRLTRRLGLPVIPLACLFIRAMLQTYHMFLATNVSPPVISSVTGIALDANATATSSPALAQIDHIFRTALGRSSFGGGSPSPYYTWRWTFDDIIALATMIFFFLALFLVLLAFKLILGMVLLSVAHERYKGMKEREENRVFETTGKRVGGWGVVEVDDEKRQWIYEDDPEGYQAAKDRDARAKEKDMRGGSGKGLDGVERYRMLAKRIW